MGSIDEVELHRSAFPENFVFGAATAAYQVEGAANEGGRGPSVWDKFSHTKGKILDNGNGDLAVDQYHRYKEDVDNLKSMHMDAYRFSISWSRIMPNGLASEVNQEGISYYNRLINDLLSKGIQPYVTLYHWDLPQALEDSIGGWPNRGIVKYFTDYAEVCFSEFGDRVKNWITFNEPQQFCWYGYGAGVHAPGKTSDRSRSAVGDSSTEPYLAAHHALLAHGTVVQMYRERFQPTQEGTIGLTLDCEWGEPMTDAADDVAAAKRRVLFQLGWFLDPLYFGDYPAVMRENVGSRLPTFSADEKALLRHSTDFIGLNHYTTKYVSASEPSKNPVTIGFWQDQCISTTDFRDGVQVGPQAHSGWLFMVPWGMEKVLLWLWERYKTPIYVTENGMDTKNDQFEGQSVPQESLRDTRRVQFFQDYLRAILRAIRKGADIRCYFAWSLVDNFEWALGYSSRFGLYYVDYFTLERYPKDSARWFTEFLRPKGSLSSGGGLLT